MSFLLKVPLMYLQKYIPRIAIGQDTGIQVYKLSPKVSNDKDLTEFSKIKKICYKFDESVLLLPFGLGGFVRLIPFLGNYLVLMLNLIVFYKIYNFTTLHDNFNTLKTKFGNFKIPSYKLLRLLSPMLLNIGIDFSLGLLPIVGYFLTIGVKCNTRNLNMLFNWLNNSETKFSLKDSLDIKVTHREEQNLA